MAADPAAYAALGVDPGASGAEVERAYKALIKQFHPDRSGGDAVRAAEINRAYQQLRTAFREESGLALHPIITRRAPGWSRTAWAAVLLLCLGSAAAILKLMPPPAVLSAAKTDAGLIGPAGRGDVMDRPLAVGAIDQAVAEAVRLSKVGDEMRLTALSRQCHAGLRMKPELATFDRCAAFDDAVIRLQDRDPLRDRGAFSQIAVSGRLWSAATYLTGDYLATDSRLQRIHLRVDLLLAPVNPATAEAR